MPWKNTHPVYEMQLPEWRIVQDVYDGEKAIKNPGKAKEYLPVDPMEKTDTYNRRVRMARLFNALKRAINGLSGMIFRKNVTVSVDEGKYPFFDQIIKNTNRCGDGYFRFSVSAFNLLLRRGHVLILVDYPDYLPGLTVEEKESKEIRPFYTLIDPMDVPFWWTKKDETGKEKFVEIVVCRSEIYLDEKGVLKTKKVYYQYTPGMVAIWEEIGGKLNKISEKVMAINGEPLQEIPIVVIYGEQLGVMQSEPPMIEFALENVSHYQIRADYRFSNHAFCYPVACFSGTNKSEIGESVAVGGERALAFKNPDTKSWFLEPSGRAPETASKELSESESRMAVYSLSIFDRANVSANETLGAKKMKATAEFSVLAMFAISLATGLTEANRLAFKWEGITPDSDPVADLNLDFTSLFIDAQTIAILKDMAEKRDFPMETLWDILRESGLKLPSNAKMRENIRSEKIEKGEEFGDTGDEETE